MRQLDSNVVIKCIRMLIGRWMIDRGLPGARIVQETEIPAVGETEHQFNTVEITDQHPIPGTGVDRPVTERDACSVNVAPTGRVRPNLLNNVDKISNERGTGADRFLVALARSWRSGRGQVAEDDGADCGDNFFNDIDRKERAEIGLVVCRAGDEGLGRRVELVDERPSDSVAVNLKFHRNLRP